MALVIWPWHVHTFYHRHLKRVWQVALIARRPTALSPACETVSAWYVILMAWTCLKWLGVWQMVLIARCLWHIHTFTCMILWVPDMSIVWWPGHVLVYRRLGVWGMVVGRWPTYFHLLETTFSVYQKALIRVLAHTYLQLHNNSAEFLMAFFHLQNVLI
jgi:hypothetical protein